METPPSEPTHAISLKKKIFYIAVILCISGLGALIILEIGSRIFLKNIVSPLIPDPEIGQVYRPNFESTRYIDESQRTIHLLTNSDGYRDDEWDIATTALKVMVIGDSFVDATQVEKPERFTELLEDRFRASSTPIEVFNFGKSGSGPEAYYLVLKKWRDIIKPDIVIVSVFNGNDFDNVNYRITPNSGRINYIVTDKGIERYSDLASHKEKMKWNWKVILGRSYFVQILNDFAIRMRASSGPAATSDAPRQVPLYCQTENAERKNSYAIVDKLVRDMKQIAGDKLIVLQIPEREQYASKIEGCDNDLPETFMKHLSENAGFPVVQMTNFFGSEPQKYYYPGHLNPEGHKLVTEALYKEMQKKLASQLRK